MSGMFYSLEEAAEKLNKSKDEIKKLVREGQLREFRDGPNVLFKVDEVEALIPETEISGPSDAQEPVELAEEEMEIPELSAEEPSEEAVSEEPVSEGPAEIELKPEEPPAESEEMPDFDMETSIAEVPEETTESEEAESQAQEPVSAEDEDLDNILLGQETGTPAVDSDLTDGDTALPGQGTSILGQTDNKEYELTDDTMADTVIVEGTKGGSAPEGLDEAEEDVNLDSFGSGSGLLDLSLQADDTSLGGILDEIYTDESKEPSAKEAKADAGEEAEISDESEEPAPAGIGEDISAPQLTGEPEAAMQAGLVVAQVPPDSQSNILGMLLFIPIAVVIYTVIVALAGIRGFLPSILTIIQIWVWPIMGALGLVSLVVIVAAFMLTGEKSAVPKEKKVKKEKPPKVKKEKAPKPVKEKPAKEEKKEKKKFFRLK